MTIAEVIIKGGYFSWIIISLIMTLIVTLLQKKLVNQDDLRAMKRRQKELHRERKNVKDEKALREIEQEIMEISAKIFKSSITPTLVIIIPIIFLFGWLSSNVAYHSFKPGEEFNLTAVIEDAEGRTAELVLAEGLTAVNGINQTIKRKKAVWTLKGAEGKYEVGLNVDGNRFRKEIIISSGAEYAPLVEKPCNLKFIFCWKNENKIKSVSLNNKKIVYLNIFGIRAGWLMTYIIFSIILSILARKIFNMA